MASIVNDNEEENIPDQVLIMLGSMFIVEYIKKTNVVFLKFQTE